MKRKSPGLYSFISEIGSSINQSESYKKSKYKLGIEEFLLAIVNHPYVGLTLYDTALKKHVWVNQAYLTQSGYSRNEVLENGHDFLKTTLPIEDFKMLSDLFSEPYQLDKGYAAHYRKKNQLGGYDWYFLSGYPLVDNGPKSKLVFCYIINLSKEFHQIGVQKSKLQILINHCNNNGIPLTPREVDVLSKLIEGLSQKQIAGALNISFYTVETHKKHIFKKLNVHSIAALAAYVSKLHA